MTRVPLASLLFFSLVGLASAETYDLKEILLREPPKGQRFHEVSSESESGRQVIRREGQVVQDQSEQKSETYARKVEVLKAKPSGEALETRYVYESYERKQGETRQVLEVEGLELVVDNSSSPARVKVAGKRELPPFLENKLQDESAESSREERSKQLTPFLPKEAVAAGSTWKGDADGALDALKLDKKGVKSKKLVGALTKGKAEGMLQLSVELEVVYSSYQGMPCKEPMKLTVKIEATFSGKAPDHTGSSSQTMTLGGVVEMQGMEVAIDVVQTSKTKVTLAKK